MATTEAFRARKRENERRRRARLTDEQRAAERRKSAEETRRRRDAGGVSEDIRREQRRNYARARYSAAPPSESQRANIRARAAAQRARHRALTSSVGISPRNPRPWSEGDDSVALDRSLSLVEAAVRLHRTPSAVANRRYYLRRAAA